MPASIPLGASDDGDSSVGIGISNERASSTEIRSVYISNPLQRSTASFHRRA